MHRKTDFCEGHPNVKGIFFDIVIMGKCFLFSFFVFSKRSIIIIREIHNKHTVLFLKHRLVFVVRNCACCLLGQINVNKSSGAGGSRDLGRSSALSVITGHPSISWLLNEIYSLHVAKGLSHTVAPWLITLRQLH